jgi:MscS family membrane protein
LLKESKIKNLLLIFSLLFWVTLSAEVRYDPFISGQIQYIDRLGSVDVTQEEIKRILLQQKKSYADGLEDIMSKKQAYIDKMGIYDSKIFALEKIIKINKRAGNKYAVLRDEVQVKSFKILTNQKNMMRTILSALDDTSSVEFSKKLDKLIAKNILDNRHLVKDDYQNILNVKSTSKALARAKENIEDFYAIIDINTDVLNYLRISENKMYRLNKYSKYNLIGLALLVQKSRVADTINPILAEYGLDVVKLMMIVFLILIIYITRKFIYIIVERKVANIESDKEYAKEILHSIRKHVERLILVLNLNMIVYVFSDFNTQDVMVKLFNMLYSGIFALMIYKILNVVAKIKINNLDSHNSKVKNDVINVGIKIVNFMVLIMGLMLVLHFAGANLTAILSGLGIGGLAVALAAKDSLANFFGTLSILFSDVLSQGDWIEVHGEQGVVVEIGTRVTTLRTFDNALVAIPNAILANEDVKNWNKRSLGRRIKMDLGIKYDSKSEDIKNTIYEIREMLDKHHAIATENTEHTYRQRSGPRLVSQDDAQGIKKTLLVYLDEFTDSSINILVYCFTKSVDWEDWLATKEDIMHKIMAIFEKNNIEFAFPSLSIYNEQMK